MSKQQQTEKLISPSTLGRFRANYDKIRKLKDIGDVEAAVKQRMQQDAQLSGVTLESFIKQLEGLNHPSGDKVRVIEKQHRLTLANGVAEFFGILNRWKLNGYKDLDNKSLAKAYENMSIQHSDAYGKTVRTDSKRRDLFASMSTIWTPHVDAKGKPNNNNLMGVYSGGWGDGSKDDRDQYFSRFVPAAKRTGYLKDSIALNIPIADKKKDKVNKGKVKPEKTPEKNEGENTPPPPSGENTGVNSENVTQ